MFALVKYKRFQIQVYIVYSNRWHISCSSSVQYLRLVYNKMPNIKFKTNKNAMLYNTAYVFTCKLFHQSNRNKHLEYEREWKNHCSLGTMWSLYCSASSTCSWPLCKDVFYFVLSYHFTHRNMYWIRPILIKTEDFFT